MQLNVRIGSQPLRKKTMTMARMRAGMICTRCNDTIIMPEWSEWVDAGYARHQWHCDTCDYVFETRVEFAAA